jgi:hypothetical protein
MTNNKQQTEHRFCLTPELKCTMSYCDENGCINRKRHLVGDPIEMTNNKQQTAVKLYTEEQVLQIIGNLNREYFVTPEELLEEMKLTPIELPSDEEIVQRSKEEPENSNIETAARIGYVAGAKWMRDKIQGGKI